MSGSLSKRKSMKKSKEHKDKVSQKRSRTKENEYSKADLDTSLELFSIGHYLKDRSEVLEEMLRSVSAKALKNMLPEVLKCTPMDELKELFIEELEVMSKKRIRTILAGKEMSSSSESEESDSEDETVVSSCEVKDDTDIVPAAVSVSDSDTELQHPDSTTSGVPDTDEPVTCNDRELSQSNVESPTSTTIDKPCDTVAAEDIVQQRQETRPDIRYQVDHQRLSVLADADAHEVSVDTTSAMAKSTSASSFGEMRQTRTFRARRRTELEDEEDIVNKECELDFEEFAPMSDEEEPDIENNIPIGSSNSSFNHSVAAAECLESNSPKDDMKTEVDKKSKREHEHDVSVNSEDNSSSADSCSSDSDDDSMIMERHQSAENSHSVASDEKHSSGFGFRSQPQAVSPRSTSSASSSQSVSRLFSRKRRSANSPTSGSRVKPPPRKSHSSEKKPAPWSHDKYTEATGAKKGPKPSLKELLRENHEIEEKYVRKPKPKDGKAWRWEHDDRLGTHEEDEEAVLAVASIEANRAVIRRRQRLRPEFYLGGEKLRNSGDSGCKFDRNGNRRQRRNRSDSFDSTHSGSHKSDSEFDEVVVEDQTSDLEEGEIRTVKVPKKQTDEKAVNKQVDSASHSNKPDIECLDIAGQGDLSIEEECIEFTEDCQAETSNEDQEPALSSGVCETENLKDPPEDTETAVNISKPGSSEVKEMLFQPSSSVAMETGSLVRLQMETTGLGPPIEYTVQDLTTGHEVQVPEGTDTGTVSTMEVENEREVVEEGSFPVSSCEIHTENLQTELASPKPVLEPRSPASSDHEGPAPDTDGLVTSSHCIPEPVGTELDPSGTSDLAAIDVSKMGIECTLSEFGGSQLLVLQSSSAVIPPHSPRSPESPRSSGASPCPVRPKSPFDPDDIDFDDYEECGDTTPPGIPGIDLPPASIPIPLPLATDADVGDPVTPAASLVKDGDKIKVRNSIVPMKRYYEQLKSKKREEEKRLEQRVYGAEQPKRPPPPEPVFAGPALPPLDQLETQILPAESTTGSPNPQQTADSKRTKKIKVKRTKADEMLTDEFLVQLEEQRKKQQEDMREKMRKLEELKRKRAALEKEEKATFERTTKEVTLGPIFQQDDGTSGSFSSNKEEKKREKRPSSPQPSTQTASKHVAENSSPAMPTSTAVLEPHKVGKSSDNVAKVTIKHDFAAVKQYTLCFLLLSSSKSSGGSDTTATAATKSASAAIVKQLPEAGATTKTDTKVSSGNNKSKSTKRSPSPASEGEITESGDENENESQTKINVKTADRRRLEAEGDDPNNDSTAARKAEKTYQSPVSKRSAFSKTSESINKRSPVEMTDVRSSRHERPAAFSKQLSHIPSGSWKVDHRDPDRDFDNFCGDYDRRGRNDKYTNQDRFVDRSPIRDRYDGGFDQYEKNFPGGPSKYDSRGRSDRGFSNIRGYSKDYGRSFHYDAERGSELLRPLRPEEKFVPVPDSPPKKKYHAEAIRPLMDIVTKSSGPEAKFRPIPDATVTGSRRSKKKSKKMKHKRSRSPSLSPDDSVSRKIHKTEKKRKSTAEGEPKKTKKISAPQKIAPDAPKISTAEMKTKLQHVQQLLSELDKQNEKNRKTDVVAQIEDLKHQVELLQKALKVRYSEMSSASVSLTDTQTSQEKVVSKLTAVPVASTKPSVGFDDPNKQSQKKLDMIELEMRARAIKALIKRKEDKETV